MCFVYENVCIQIGKGGEVRWVELFAHRGKAHGDTGIPVLGPHAVTVFPPGLQCWEHNTNVICSGSHAEK